VKLISFAIDNYCMSGIATALIADHYIGVLGEKVCNFCLSFITELRTYYNYVSQRYRLSKRCENTTNPAQ